MSSETKKGSGIIGKIIRWCFCILCFGLVLGTGFSVGAVIFLLVGIAALPIKPIKNLWSKIPIQKKWFKPVVLAVLFFIAFGFAPASDVEPDNQSGIEAEVEDNQGEEFASTDSVEESPENEVVENETSDLPVSDLQEPETSEPTTPDALEEPEVNEPTTPAEPEEPEVNKPTTPAEPEEPEVNEPTTPVEPEEPEVNEPTTPAEPEEPEVSEPTTPDEPEEPEVNEPTTPPEDEKESNDKSESTNTATGKYAVNTKNGKIHIVGACSATGDGENAMTSPKYFDSYEEAEEYSKRIKSKLEKRKCGNCW